MCFFCVLLVFGFHYSLIGQMLGFRILAMLGRSCFLAFLNHEICQQTFRVTITAQKGM